MHQPQAIVLKNGLRLVMTPMPQIESTAVMVGVGAGSRFENAQNSGIFHFLEHMAFKGTKKRPSALKLATEIDGVGGEFNAFTGKELTGYYIKSAAQHQELSFDILSDILLNSLFDEREIEKEKGVIVEEINMYEDDPTHKVMEEFIRLLFGNNSMGWSIAGSKKNVTSFKQEDFLKVLNRFYNPADMVVTVSGKLEAKKVKKFVEQYFGRLEGPGNKAEKQAQLVQKRPRTKLIYKKTEQAHFCLGLPGYELSHPNRFALGVLSSVLGGGMSSRLFSKIREERGLAYYVSCSPDFFTDRGYFLARAGVKLKGVEEAIKVTLGEFENMSRVEVAPKELKKAKDFLKGRLILALEDSWRVASRYAGQILLEGKMRTPQQTLKEIDQITAQDVQAVAKDVFKPEKLNLSLIGPYKGEARFRKILT
ncbi:M16 family metallopeptidase [Patescibacteria group bacterium]